MRREKQPSSLSLSYSVIYWYGDEVNTIPRLTANTQMDLADGQKLKTSRNNIWFSGINECHSCIRQHCIIIYV